jgi:single-strand DNA-binding protein
MFGDFNQVELIGNITNDLEVKALPSGINVLNFSIATNRRYKKDDEWQEATDFHNIVVFGNQAESIPRFARKGTRVFIQGRLQTRSWEGDDGKKNYRTEVIAYRVTLLDRYEKGSKSGQSDDKNEEDTPKGGTVDPNDLPF